MRNYVLAIFLCGFSAVATANDRFQMTTNTYGTQYESVLSISAAAFQPDPGGAAGGNFWYKWTAVAPYYLAAPVHLPGGALVTRIEIDACDSSQYTSIGAELHGCTLPSASTYCLPTLGGMLTGLWEMPGCQRYPFVASSAYVIDNTTYAYTFVYKQSANVDQAAGFSAARVYYKLQVSPAPAVARFADVPTSHPFFQFIEALAASGITTGCDPNNFCPNEPITRGQMAVFLSRGLGLHWP